MTVRNGKRALLQALLKAKRLDQVKGDEEVNGMVATCSPRRYCAASFAIRPISLSKTDVVLAKLDRAELGDFDALVLGLLLMSHFKGQIVVPDFGFYGREAHTASSARTARRGSEYAE